MRSFDEIVSKALKTESRMEKVEILAKRLEDGMNKQFENLDDKVNKNKDLLDGRIDPFDGMEKRIDIINTELRKTKGMIDDDRKKVLEELNKVANSFSGLKDDFIQHVGVYNAEKNN